MPGWLPLTLTAGMIKKCLPAACREEGVGGVPEELVDLGVSDLVNLVLPATHDHLCIPTLLGRLGD